MKSRRELLSTLLIDIAKAVFVTLVIGKIVNSAITWYVTMLGIFVTALIIVGALIIHPKAEVDKEWKLW